MRALLSKPFYGIPSFLQFSGCRVGAASSWGLSRGKPCVEAPTPHPRRRPPFPHPRLVLCWPWGHSHTQKRT